MIFSERKELSFLSKTLSCLAAGLFFFFTIFQKVSFNVINDDLIQQFHLTATQLGGISSAYLYANALWLIPGGILLEKFSSRFVTIFFMLACALSSLVFAKSTSIPLDIAMRFIGGLGSAISILISLRLATRLFPLHSARAIGLLVSLGMSAGIVANAPLLYLKHLIGWQNSMMWLGYFGIAITVFMLLFLHDKPVEVEKNRIQLKSVLRDIKNVSLNGFNWKNGLYIGLMNLPIFILGSLWGNLYLEKTAYYSSDSAALVISMLFVGEIIGAPIFGWISDKLKRRKSVMVSGAIFSLMATLMLFKGPSVSYVSLLSLYFLLGFFLSAQVIAYSVVAEGNHSSVRSMASGFVSSVVNALGAIGQIVFPFVLTSGIANAYQIAFVLFPLGYCVSIFVLTGIAEWMATNTEGVIQPSVE